MLAPWNKECIKKERHRFANKGPYSQNYDFSSSHVWMWELDHKKGLMLLKCRVGLDSWESLGLQRDQTSQSWRKSVLNIHWKDWCWSRSANTLATWCEELTHWKDHNAGKDWRRRGWQRMMMVGWHHWLNGHESEQALGDSEGQGSLVFCSLLDHRVGHDWATEKYNA